MSRFQTVFLLLIAGFLLVLVYDRINAHRNATAKAEAARQQEIWDGLHRCEQPIYESMAVSGSNSKTTEALKACKDFWLPQLSKR